MIDQRNDVCNSNHKSESVTKKSKKQVFRVVGVNVNGFGLYQVVGLHSCYVKERCVKGHDIIMYILI